jgi:nicotinate-nucleotide--dimethylbenzimidazole phosphoribosyltransferase
MKLELTGLENLEYHTARDDSEIKKQNYDLLYCGVCRTDAKMFYQGQRDLHLPRVLGHEAVFRHRDSGKIYVPWPARSCGTCTFCRSGRENLCEEIRIMGFHFDGAWSDRCLVEDLLLFPVSSTASVAPHLYSFCEPAGCVLTAFSKLGTGAGVETDLSVGKKAAAGQGKRMLIVGAGTLGMICAHVAAKQGYTVTLLEKNQEKIEMLRKLCGLRGFTILKQCEEGNFNICINSCASHHGFAVALTKLQKGGTLLFFSGLTKNEQLGTNLLNLIHYRELKLRGSYGLTPAALASAISLIEEDPVYFKALVQGIVHPQAVQELLPSVWEAMILKYILDFTNTMCAENANDPPAKVGFGGGPEPVLGQPGRPEANRLTGQRSGNKMLVMEHIGMERVPEIDKELTAKAQYIIDNKTKPLGSLGKLETVAVRLCGMQGSLSPSAAAKRMLVFAGDHGLVEEGVSAFPQEVTLQMMHNFVFGGAAINVLCRQYGIDLHLVDMGVKGDVSDLASVQQRKIRRGTRNAALSTAMTEEEAKAALLAGKAAFLETRASGSCQVLGLGEMGIGNTSSATLITAAITGTPISSIVGRGTGVDDQQLIHKQKVLEKVYAFHHLDSSSAWEVLFRVGGFEIAGMAGAAMAAAAEGVAVVLDGVISTAAGLIAAALFPGVEHYFIISHQSVEQAQQHAARHLGLEPLFDLNLRLGEGSGAAIAINLVETACSIFNDMASFDDARVSGKV